MAGVPFISVHVSRQLDNQPLQWKSIVLIGLYLLYNSPAGNPWWQIISAPVFDWCFDVSDLQGQTEELVEALLTESNPALPPSHTCPKPRPPVWRRDCRRAGGRSKKKCLGDSDSTARAARHHRREECARGVQRESSLWGGLSPSRVYTWKTHTHTHTHTHTDTHTHTCQCKREQ